MNNRSQSLSGGEGGVILDARLVSSNGGSGNSGVMQGCDGSDVCASNPCQDQGLFCNDIW